MSSSNLLLDLEKVSQEVSKVVTGALKSSQLQRARQSAAERSHTTFEVRGRGWEDPMPEGQWPRGVTPRLRSGAAVESARLRRRRNGQEELPHVQGQGGGREELPSV